MYSTAYVWAKVLSYLENRLTSAVASSWFDDADVVELNDKELILFSPSPFRKDIIQRRCTSYIEEAMLELFDQHITLRVLGEEELVQFENNKKKKNTMEFNPQFTFDTFVVGSSNRFAHSAAVAVANNPGQTYNPLFLYGPAGIGKTHLLHAIATQIRANNQEYKIVYIKGDQFTNELITALQEGKNVEFRNKYREADLFLIDDIQFIAGKESTQEEFFHTFNKLYEDNKQIVMTSDRKPSDMLRLEDRLKTRFEWGLIADIQPPDYETRVAILRNKANSLGLDMPDDVYAYIAENVTTNVRQIEGTVKKILAYRDLDKMPIDLPNVSRAIKDMYKGESQTLPTPALIIAEVGRFFSIEEHVIRSTKKSKDTAEARQIAMYLIRKLTNLSLPEIGREFGRDHSTVIHSIRKVETSLKEPGNSLTDAIRDITANINNQL